LTTGCNAIEYIIDGKKLPFNQNSKQMTISSKGCQSKVWLKERKPEERILSSLQ
jgi:sulfur transfer protein SufE